MAQTDGFWMRRTADGIRGVSQAMFPTNDLGAPDWQQAAVVERTVEYLGMLPPHMRRLLMLLFVAVELAAPLLFVSPGRFSRASLARRERVLAAWKRSRLPFLKLLYDALKAQLCMMYLSHPAVQRHMQVWKTCGRENDPLALPVRADVFDGTTRNGLREDFA